MQQIRDFLDDLPLATVAFIVFAVAGLVAFFKGDIDFEALGVALGIGGTGTAAVGATRTYAGKGLRKRDIRRAP